MADVEQFMTARKIKKGEFVKRKADAAKVYVRDKYCRSSKKIALIDFDDFCRVIYVKPDAALFVGFEF